jgi:soluble lytic murein transglycosylase
MQLMPSTARMVAKHNGLDYDEELLHTPEFNIPIGTMYLKRVLERFDGNPVFAAAAYNAGPTNARRWVNRYGELPLDEFVERIPFGETQRYVKRVFLSYLVYTQLYR